MGIVVEVLVLEKKKLTGMFLYISEKTTEMGVGAEEIILIV